MASFDDVRSAVLSSGSEARVEVNQRALIDKILARYATHGAVYRELLQNSNDANARNAEIYFTTAAPPPSSASPTPTVTQVVYRNDGHPFRPEDWTRLRNIAEGNPDVSKVGAFGVGAYTMFSICEQPLVISNKTALAFAWRGDALWARTGPAPSPDPVWTSFVLPSRDPYPLPDIVPFAQFLCSSLTFTASLSTIRLFINDTLRLTIAKKILEAPRPLIPPRSTSWFSNDGMNTTSPNSLFTIPRDDQAISQSLVSVSVDIDSSRTDLSARFISASANVRVPPDMRRKIVRVTKKDTPPTVKVQVFVDAAARPERTSPAAAPQAVEIADAFSPAAGAGHVYIGFRTSQTTGLAAHLAAPLVPTVEREAVDLQNPALCTYNSDLLFVAGMLMRLTLEHSMTALGARFEETALQRAAEEKKLLEQQTSAKPSTSKPEEPAQKEEEKEKESGFNFVRFMTSGVRRIADVLTNVVDSTHNAEDLLNPPDLRPLSAEERDAIMLMKAFSPKKSTPDPTVGVLVAKGFSRCMPSLAPPVLTQSGFARGAESRLPFRGIEAFVKAKVVRKVVFENAENYLLHVAGCKRLAIEDLRKAMTQRVLDLKELERFLRWWAQFYRASPGIQQGESLALKHCVSFRVSESTGSQATEGEGQTIELKNVRFFSSDQLASELLPMPQSVIPRSIEKQLTLRVLQEAGLRSWFEPLPFEAWGNFIVKHPYLTEGKPEHNKARLDILVALNKEHTRRGGADRPPFEKWLRQSLSKCRCVLVDSPQAGTSSSDFPGDLYLSNAEIGIFQGLGSFRRVSPQLKANGISDDFLLAIGVRKAISIDFLLTHLDTLKWSENPAPLIKYLRSVVLSQGDLDMLRSSQYLPEAKDKSRMYAPPELYLPSADLSIFSFIKILQWPVPEDLHERSPDYIFLKELGCFTDPPLEKVITFIEKEVKDEALHLRCLEFLSKRLGPRGPYDKNAPQLQRCEILPTTCRHPLDPEKVEKQRSSAADCFWDPGCEKMGFKVLDHATNQATGGVLADRFQCPREPNPDQLIAKLVDIVTAAKRLLEKARHSPDYKATATRVIEAMNVCYRYLETRTTHFGNEGRNSLRGQAFIPYQGKDGVIQWIKPTSVYFSSENDDITNILYPSIPFDGFLASIGVRSQPLLSDVFSLMVRSPQEVLKKLGSEDKYCELLRRVAASPPFQSPTTAMRNSPFLIAYRFDGASSSVNGDEQAELKAKYALAKASEICIIDNAFMSRLFPVLTAPQESDLERLYQSLGSRFISKEVNQQFLVNGAGRTDTSNVKFFVDRLTERRPLLVSGNASSRPMHSNAAILLSSENLAVSEVTAITATYSLRGMKKSHEVTCCSKKNHGTSSDIYLTADFDWFDVGNAIGTIILKRCHLEDAFLLGSMLEAPLSQLRARGFPVDRILRAAEPVSTEPIPPAGTTSRQTPAAPNQPQAQQITPGRAESKEKLPTPPNTGDEVQGFPEILKQMFPDCEPAHIRKLLGGTPSLDTLRQAADALADGNYPKSDPAVGGNTKPKVGSNTDDSGKQSDTRGSSSTGWNRKNSSDSSRGSSNPAGRLINRALRSFSKHAASNPLASDVQSGVHQTASRAKPPTNMGGLEPGGKSVTKNHDDMERMLMDTTKQMARPVSEQGVQSQPRYDPVVPEGLRDGASCEAVEGVDLKLVNGPQSTGTSNGMKVFASRKTANAVQFISQHWAAVEKFSQVLLNLSRVFELRADSMAVYYEAHGKTIAFNTGGALHFNLRFFHALHYNGGSEVRRDCYAYWYTVMAHELAHNLVSAHNQQHGFFTESYISTALPKLFSMMEAIHL